MSSKYLEQYERVKRWYEKFKSINEGKEHRLGSDYYQDEVYAFFINCYHLKDWIRNDPEVKDTLGEKVEAFVSASEVLLLCGAICTGSKHLLINDPRFNPLAKIGGRAIGLVLGMELPRINIKYKVETGGVSLDAFELATRCLGEWDKFLGK